jgi:hypothetical protein
MRRVLRVAEEEPLLVILLAGFAVVFLSIFPPQLLVNDSFLTLVGGREIVEHGLPSEDELTVLGSGREWTDQQWGAQVVAYGAHELGGHPLLAVVAGLLVVGAFAIAVAGARSLGAGPRAIVLVFFPVLLAAPWAWTIRAQVFVLPLYTGLVWLLASEARRPSRKAFLAIPMLVVWANLHGSVALGATLTMLLALTDLVASRGRRVARDVALLVLAPLAVLATPYGPATTLDYYRLMLVDPPFADWLTEWQPGDPGWDTLAFYVLAAGAAIALALGRRRVHAFDVVLLAFTFVGGVLAIRGVPWFALGCMVLVPPALGAALEGQPAPVRQGVNRALAAGAAVAVALTVVVALARDASWYESKWPNDALAPVAASTAGGERVLAMDRQADWLLWKLPALRGRIAYDVRFELFDEEFFRRLADFKLQRSADWKSFADGYPLVVVDERLDSPPTEDLLAEPGASRLYGDERITVVRRQAPS